MVLRAKSKVIKSPNSRTQYITIPAAMVSDSQYPLKPDQEVEIEIHTDEHRLEIYPVKQKGEGKVKEVVR
jgi:antitoxin component of MazEF toxin-antitoxin module